MVLNQQQAQARLQWVVGRMPGMEGVGVKVVGELPEVRLFWTQFTQGERMVTAKVPRSLIAAVDIERGILPLAMSDYLRGILLMFGSGSDASPRPPSCV